MATLFRNTQNLPRMEGKRQARRTLAGLERLLEEPFAQRKAKPRLQVDVKYSPQRV